MEIDELRQRKDFNRAMADWFRVHGLRRMVFGAEYVELNRAVYGYGLWRLKLSMFFLRLAARTLRMRVRIKC